MINEKRRQQPDPKEGTAKTDDRDLQRQDGERVDAAEPTEQGVDLDPKRRID
ncbi:hypothetical protein [Rhizobium sp. AG855]|uniref:hypothetical protein n=1 Tax=Rhizobium sp. AG855 TaxID=2183898 RepID=UPI000FEDA86A|nr:hypothetical protein [Rhizobium sp. AG855]RKE77578.1 hypothetical protein DFO46_4546 [Rhizobium sp. AG855]